MKGTSRVVLALAVVAALLAVTGCGALVEQAVKGGVENATGVKVDQGGNSVTVTGQDGSSMTSSSDGKLPEGFPSDMPLYTPGKIVTSAVSTENSAKSFVVTIDSPDAVADIFAWYKAQLPEKGWTVQNTTESDTGALFMGEKGAQAFTVMVATSSAEGATTISISVAPASK
jgi:hypothetical protein